MSDIQFPRNQQSIADLATPAQSGPPAPPPEVPDISESSLLDVQAVFVSPRRVVDDGGVQLLFRDSERGEVLRSFPPEQASSVYQSQQENNERLSAPATSAAATTETLSANVEIATPEVAATPESPADEAVSDTPAPATGNSGSDAGILTTAALSPSNDQAGGSSDSAPADDGEIALTN